MPRVRASFDDSDDAMLNSDNTTSSGVEQLRGRAGLCGIWARPSEAGCLGYIESALIGAGVVCLGLSACLPSVRVALSSVGVLLVASPFALTFALQWGSRAARYLPRQSALDQTYDYAGEVLIVGAGAAGLAAARILEKNQIRYSILEATARHGGRLKADSGFADFPVDLGAEWIHNLPGILDVLSPGAGAQTELVPYRLEDVCRLEEPGGEGGGNRTIKKVSSLSTDAYFWFFPEYKFKRSTWYDFVCRHVAEGVQHRIQYNAPITEVDCTGQRVQVKTANGELFVADKLLMTVSVGVLRSGDISFLPELSARKQAALASVQFLPGFKLLLKFSERFYPDGIDFEEEVGEKGFFDMALEKECKDHVLGLLVTGPATEPYYALASDELIVAAALAELDALFEGRASRSFSGEHRLEDWGRQAYTQGTWVEGLRIDGSTLAELNMPLERKVFFAGEAHDVNRQMGVPGAVLSGYDAVDRMLRQEEEEEGG